MTRKILFACVLVVTLIATTLEPAQAHGLIGKRFLPATLAIDDPFVADELSLPTIFHIQRRGSEESAPTKETDLSGEFSKRLSPDLGLSLGGTFKILDPDPGKTVSGFDNLEVALKYVFVKSEAHEMLLSLGLSWDVGGTGSKKVDAESFSTWTPSLFFGKGFGDLPDQLDLLKPLAVTGALGWAVPSRIHTKTFETSEDGDVEVKKPLNPTVFQWGFTFQYSLQYLQSYVRDVGLPAPLNRMIPIVEVALETPIDGRDAGHTTGTVNPGIIWFGTSSSASKPWCPSTPRRARMSECSPRCTSIWTTSCRRSSRGRPSTACWARPSPANAPAAGGGGAPARAEPRGRARLSRPLRASGRAHGGRFPASRPDLVRRPDRARVQHGPCRERRQATGRQG